MKILPIVNSIRNDIAKSGSRLKNATKYGYSIADRTAKIYKQPYYAKYLNATRCVSNKVMHGTTKKEIPYIAGAIGAFLPLPLSCPILFGLGFILRAMLSKNTEENENNTNITV